MFDVNCTSPRAGLTEEGNFNPARDEVVLILVKPFAYVLHPFINPLVIVIIKSKSLHIFFSNRM